jgi:hypothetical protein
MALTKTAVRDSEGGQVWGCVSLCVAQPGRAIGTDEIVTGIIMSAADQAPSEVVWSLGVGCRAR